MGRYLVTGGAGFIGSHLVERLLVDGHEVVVLDDLSTGRRVNVEDALADVPSHGDRPSAGGRLYVEERLSFIEASVLDGEALDRAVDGVEAVFHQAAIASVPRSFDDPRRTLGANVEGTAAVLEACRRSGVERVVYASSSSVYGDTPTLPKEESMPPSPMSPYALSKYAGEHLASIWATQYGMTVIGLRYFNVFGPRQDPASEYAAVVPRFITRMLAGKRPIVFGDGRQSRDFTYVDNAVHANLLAAAMVDGVPGAELSEAGGGFAAVVNVGVGERYTLLELVAALNEIIGTDLEPEFDEPRPGDVRHSQAAIHRARSVVGYEPRVGFVEGLRRTVESFRSGLEGRQK